MAKVRVRRRKKTYSYIFEAGKTADGKRKVVEKGGFATRKEAYTAGAAAYTDYRHGNIGITSETILLGDYLDAWLESVCHLNVRETTFGLYQNMIRLHIRPQLGSIKVQDLTPSMLDRWLRALAGEGLSYKSLQLILAVLRNALGYAVYPGQLIASNPATYIDIPRTAPKHLVQRDIIKPAEVQALLEKFPMGHAAHIPILLLYHTGMRIGEVMGLCWQDIDFKARQITVRMQIRYITEKHGCYHLPPKTSAGARTIDVDPALLQELSAWKKMQAEEELRFGPSYRCNYVDAEHHLASGSKGISRPPGQRVDLVCTKRNGAFISPDIIRWRIRQEGYNSHSFRHTHATLLIEHGASAKGVAGRLGHASTLLTQDLYTHNTAKLQKDTEKIFEQTLQPEMQTKQKCRQNADK